MRGTRYLGTGLALALTMALPAGAVTLLPSTATSSGYIAIHTGSNVFSHSSSTNAWGRIKAPSNPASPPSIAGPSDPSKSQNVPSTNQAPDYSGDIALTHPGADINFQTTDTYGSSDGGIDCAGANCIDAISNSDFFSPTTPGGTSLGTGFDQGINQGVDFSETGNGLNKELADQRAFIEANRFNSTDYNVLELKLPEEGKIDNYYPGDKGDFFVNSNLTGGSLMSGLNFVNITNNNGGDSDITFGNSNIIIDGPADAFVIFLMDFTGGSTFGITNSRILAGSNMGLNNILFGVFGQKSDTTIDFSQSEVQGVAFRNFASNGVIDVDNLRGCGQWVAPEVSQWNDFSVNRCGFDTTTLNVIPVPAGLPLIATAFGLAWIVRRRAVA